MITNDILLPFILPVGPLIHFVETLILFCIQVKVGDTLDLVLSENREENTVTLMRVIIRKVLGESSTEKYKVAIRRWKCVELPKDEAFKP